MKTTAFSLICMSVLAANGCSSSDKTSFGGEVTVAQIRGPGLGPGFEDPFLFAGAYLEKDADVPYEFPTQTDHCHIGYRYNGALDDPGLPVQRHATFYNGGDVITVTGGTIPEFSLGWDSKLDMYTAACTGAGCGPEELPVLPPAFYSAERFSDVKLPGNPANNVAAQTLSKALRFLPFAENHMVYSATGVVPLLSVDTIQVKDNQPLKFTWTPVTKGEAIMNINISVDGITVQTYCENVIDDGEFTIPAEVVATMPPQGYIFSGPNPHTSLDIGDGHLLGSVAFSCNAGPYQKVP
jgi:hypothetical protein